MKKILSLVLCLCMLLTALPPYGGIFLDPHDAAAMAPIPF